MKLLLQLAAAATFLTVQAQEQAISDFSSGTIGSFSGTVGWTFTPLVKTVVTDLGCFDYIVSDHESVQVGLWADNGQLLASNSVSYNSLLVDQSRYAPITPLSLQPGQLYHLGIYCPDFLTGADVAGPVATNSFVALSPAIQLGGLAQSTNGFSYPNVELGGSGSIYVGPNFRLWSAPAILGISPTNQTVQAGSNAVFTLTTTGTGPLNYRWFFNGTNLGVSSGNPLILPGVQPAQAGPYFVIVSNLAGAATSAVATLKVSLPLILSAPFRTPTNVMLTFNSVSGHSYTLEYKNSLTNLQWLPVPPTVPGTGGPLTLLDTNPPSPMRFFRLRSN